MKAFDGSRARSIAESLPGPIAFAVPTSEWGETVSSLNDPRIFWLWQPAHPPDEFCPSR
jgi:hypothetical protein